MCPLYRTPRSPSFSIPTPVQELPYRLRSRAKTSWPPPDRHRQDARLPAPDDRAIASKPGRRIHALVLVPTRELAMQVADQYNALRGISFPKPHFVVKGTFRERQLHSLRRGARLVVATPGRWKISLTAFSRFPCAAHAGARRVRSHDGHRIHSCRTAHRRNITEKPPDHVLFGHAGASVAHLVTDHMRTPVRVEIGSVLKPSENVRIQAFQVSVARSWMCCSDCWPENRTLLGVCTHQAQH